MRWLALVSLLLAALAAVVAGSVVPGLRAAHAQPLPYFFVESIRALKAGKWTGTGKDTVHLSPGQTIRVRAEYRWWDDGPSPHGVYFELKRRPSGRYYPSSPSIFSVKLHRVRHLKGDDTFTIQSRLPQALPAGQVLIVFVVSTRGTWTPIEFHLPGKIV